MKYFGKFPKVWYSFDGAPNQIVTDITFPIHLLEPYASDAKYWYTTIIKDGLRPEHVAHLVYGDVTKHWIVLHFNKIIDPLFQWPLSSTDLDSYIAKKYGSIGIAQATVAKYYKLIKRSSSTVDFADTQKLEIGVGEYANVPLNLGGSDILLSDGSVVKTVIDRSTLSVYDQEVADNDARREIRLIQTPYIDGIITSFNKLTQ